jgi:hypothetical protein
MCHVLDGAWCDVVVCDGMLAGLRGYRGVGMYVCEFSIVACEFPVCMDPIFVLETRVGYSSLTDKELCIVAS